MAAVAPLRRASRHAAVAQRPLSFSHRWIASASARQGPPHASAGSTMAVFACRRICSRQGLAGQERFIQEFSSALMDNDPGRRALACEFLTDGLTLLDAKLENGGSLQVTAHSSSESSAPENAPKDTTQEWRVLRFSPEPGSDTDLLQSVTKVCIGPPGSDPAEWLRCDALPLDYTKTIVATVLAGLAVLGTPVLTGSEAAKPLRILCIGLGGGSVPSFFEQRVPHCEVDVVELDCGVVRAARQFMGFVPGPRLHVHVADGAAFALRTATDAAQRGDGVYDAVVVDAYDAAGNVPAALWREGGALPEALRRGLLRSTGGLVATNFLPFIDLTPPSRVYADAMVQHGTGLGFSVQAEGTGNRLLVQMCSGSRTLPTLEELPTALRKEAVRIADMTACPFEMHRLVARNLTMW